MQDFVFFPSKDLEFSLQKNVSFYFENQRYTSVIDCILGSSKGKGSKQCLVCNDNNIAQVEKCLIEVLKQHKHIRDSVLATKDKDLAYAIAVDGDWGIGFKPNDPEARRKENWKCKNLLGDILARVRKLLQENPELYTSIQNNQTKVIEEKDHKPSFNWREVSKNLNEKFTFFWRAESPFSQHHPTKFYLDGHTFNCAEQYYMYMKAVTFYDENTKEEILRTSNPMKQKSLGKGVINFNANKWDTIAEDIVFRANMAKFGQNLRLLKLLLMTAGTSLVEASPKDNKWGVGLEAHDVEVFRRKTWKGTNWLGKTLDKVREHLIIQKAQSDYTFEYLIPDCYMSFSKSASPFHYTHLCSFDVEGFPYISLNHYIVYSTAELFGDVRVIDEIKSCMDNSRMDKLFASIKGFNYFEWNKHLNEYLRVGNYNKFIQNENLLGQLLDTAGCILVFKNSDSTLGNGSRSYEEEEILNDNWNGKNLLGLSLTSLRDEYLRSDGNFRPEKSFDQSMYTGLKGVSFLNSKNYKKRMEANKCMSQNNESTFKLQTNSRSFAPNLNYESKFKNGPNSNNNNQGENRKNFHIDNRGPYNKLSNAHFTQHNYDKSEFSNEYYSNTTGQAKWTKNLDQMMETAATYDNSPKIVTNDSKAKVSNIEREMTPDSFRSLGKSKVLSSKSTNKITPNPFDDGIGAFINEDVLKSGEGVKILTQYIYHSDTSLYKDSNIIPACLTNNPNLGHFNSDSNQEKISFKNDLAEKDQLSRVCGNNDFDRSKEDSFHAHKHIDQQNDSHGYIQVLQVTDQTLTAGSFDENKTNFNVDRNVAERFPDELIKNVTENFILPVNAILPLKPVASIKDEEPKKLPNDINKEEHMCENMANPILDNEKTVNRNYEHINETMVLINKDSLFSPTSEHSFELSGINFPSVNHYIYWKQAEIYEQEDLKIKILETKKSIAINKRFDKEFKYRNFDLDKWYDVAESVLTEAYLAKLNLNKELKKLLEETKGLEIKFISHTKNENFIGAGEDLKGKNLLGNVLTKIRDTCVLK